MLDQQFDNKESLVSVVKQHYADLGVATKIVRSKDGKVWIGCDRGGSYRNYLGLSDETRRRRTASRLVGCQFRIVGKRLPGGKWIVADVKDAHNHEVSIHMNGHPSYRKLSENHKIKVRELAAAGVRPRQILAALKNDSPGCSTSRKTIENELSSARKEFLAGRRPVEALVDILKQGPYIYYLDVGPTGMISRLFFCHQ